MRPQVRASKVKLIAMANRQHAKILPDVPTATDAGYKSLEFDGLDGILGPCDMPQAVRDRIAADVREAVADPDLDSKFSTVGQVFNPGTSAEFAQAMDDQLKTVKCIGDTLRWGSSRPWPRRPTLSHRRARRFAPKWHSDPLS
jgi:tripartite-type tricarboxylate transporter receptor subunit TctC